MRLVYAVTDVVVIRAQGCTAAALRSPLPRSPDSPSFHTSMFRVQRGLRASLPSHRRVLELYANVRVHHVNTPRTVLVKVISLPMSPRMATFRR